MQRTGRSPVPTPDIQVEGYRLWLQVSETLATAVTFSVAAVPVAEAGLVEEAPTPDEEPVPLEEPMPADELPPVVLLVDGLAVAELLAPTPLWLAEAWVEAP